MPRNSERGICRECQLRREIESLRWQIGEIYRLLPLHVRAGLRGQDQVYIRQTKAMTSGCPNSRRLKRLYLERDALKNNTLLIAALLMSVGYCEVASNGIISL